VWWIYILLLLPALCGSAEEEGKVTLPVSMWEQMQRTMEQEKEPDRSPVPVGPIRRKIDGTFRKGLFQATLTASFEVLDTRGHIRVPVLDGAASVQEVLLNNQRTSLLREGGMYSLGVDQPGTYTVRVRFYWGREQDRFARKLRFRLPSSGATEISVLIPEKSIEAKLAQGALISQKITPRGTQLVGHLDASGLFDLAWTRKLTHKATQALRMEARLYTLFTIQEAIVGGVAVFDLTLLDGETDRIDLRLPENIEVIRVEGDAVLQWKTEAGEDGGDLTVLLRHLVEDRVRVAVHFQFPAEEDKPVRLRMPLPPKDAEMTGALGVHGPAGLNVKVADIQEAQKLTLRDLPPELTNLASSPLLFGFRFTQPPRITLAVARHREVELVSTLIDEIQASSLLIEDGTEVTKIKLRIRNNTRQYLTMHLPEGAVLTHSLIDGRPVRPAYTQAGEGEALLFPLRQSERIGAGRERYHTVRAGETLSDVANFYYSDPSQWRGILDFNRDQMANELDMVAGQGLRIPQKTGVTVEESSFVIELAYKRKSDPLGSLGRVTVTLPKIDVDSMKAIWHVYFPRALMPLSFDTNLTQYSSIRYDPFRRIRDFLHRALFEPWAWAGGRYKSILKQRKVIYEAERRGRGEVVLAAFPLTGDRYRFKRVLLGQETPKISVTYIDRGMAAPIRWGVFLLAFFLGLWMLCDKRKPITWIITGGVLVVALLLAHYFLGTHRRIVWGVDLALLVALFRLRAGPSFSDLKDLVQSPWTIGRHLTFRNLAFVVGLCVVAWVVLTLPLLLSTVGAVVLFFWWRRKLRLNRKEVAHA
jgi:hypothetical protein